MEIELDATEEELLASLAEEAFESVAGLRHMQQPGDIRLKDYQRLNNVGKTTASAHFVKLAEMGEWEVVEKVYFPGLKRYYKVLRKVTPPEAT